MAAAPAPTLTNRQVAFSVLKWIQKQETAAALDPALQCLSRRFDLQPTDPECRDLCDVGLDLDAAVRSVAAKSAEAVAFREKRLKSFIVVLKQKGYFNGVEEGTPAYFERYEKAKEKFMARGNPYDGLTAEQLKTHGNQKMAGGQYREAVGYYTKAIEMDGQAAIYYANRAAAHTHLKDYKRAVEDCEAALRIDPTYSKAYSRLATALFYDGNYRQAVEHYAKAVELDPQNEGFQADLRAAEEKIREVEASAVPTPAFDFAGVANMLNNPEFMAMAQNVMQQPQFAEMINKVASNLGPGFTGDSMPDLTQMFANLAAQQSADGSVPDVVHTPFGDIRREQLEDLQNLPELQSNPKFRRIMTEVRRSGPTAMLRYMHDPEILATMTKLASSLFAGAQPTPSTPEAIPPAPALA
eukprot:EG_transcript_4767